MTWTIETLGKFFESKQSNPEEYNRLCREDPTTRMWAAMRKAEADYRKAHAEYHTLIPAEISPDPVRLAVVESIMNMALATRDRMKAGLEQACALLGAHQEPTVRALTGRIEHLRRQVHVKPAYADEITGYEALIASLEGIATQAGV